MNILIQKAMSMTNSSRISISLANVYNQYVMKINRFYDVLTIILCGLVVCRCSWIEPTHPIVGKWSFQRIESLENSGSKFRYLESVARNSMIVYHPNFMFERFDRLDLNKSIQNGSYSINDSLGIIVTEFTPSSGVKTADSAYIQEITKDTLRLKSKGNLLVFSRLEE